MNSEDLLVKRLIKRIDKANTVFLKNIGNTIKEIRNLTPSQAHQLVQILKYGGNYDKIINELSRYTDINVAELDEIFSKYAENDRMFYKQFYEYRNKPFTESVALREQRLALTRIAKNEMNDFTRSNVLGYTIRDLKGNFKFMGLRETYNTMLDTALLNISQGKETFDAAVSKIMQDIGYSGLKTINYKSGRAVRLDSAVNMHLKSRLRELHNENQKMIGEELNTDGIEISVHENPAPDHEHAQGKQFSNEEYKILDLGGIATDYTGEKISLDHDGKNGYRRISELNCYHYIFSIILGAQKPQYSKEQLQQIIEDNNKGFELDGKHYTNYEGTQLQRSLERRIREQKDIQILGRESNTPELVDKAQKKITELTRKYKELSEISGLKTKMQRLRTSGYRRVKV